MLGLVPESWSALWGTQQLHTTLRLIKFTEPTDLAAKHRHTCMRVCCQDCSGSQTLHLHTAVLLKQIKGRERVQLHTSGQLGRKAPQAMLLLEGHYL